MAAILLGAVVGKLAEFTVDKVLQLCGVNETIENLESLKDIVKEVENLKKELSSIQALIEDADNRRIVDKTKKEWLMDLIEIAYQIEDALDIFLLECPDSIESLPKKKLRLPYLCKFSEKMINISKKILKLSFLSGFRKKMANIQEEISRIHKRGMNYNANNLGEIIKNTQSSLDMLDPIGDPVMVGFDEDIKNIVQNLCDENYKSLAVVSIVGPGGLGKTTLARKVLYRYIDQRSYISKIIVTNFSFHKLSQIQPLN
jgi:flagellar biosynthesis GTPase FlhF